MVNYSIAPMVVMAYIKVNERIEHLNSLEQYDQTREISREITTLEAVSADFRYKLNDFF